MMLRENVHGILVSFVFLLLLLAAGPLFAQFILEANLGMNLGDVVGAKATFDGSSSSGLGTAEGAVTMPKMVAIGITAGYLTGSLFFGGELAYFSGEMSMADLKVTGGSGSGTTATGTAGKSQISNFRIGPVFRYYFLPSGLRPFVGAAADYMITTVNPETGPASSQTATLGLIEIAGTGGVLYDITPAVFIGAVARLGYLFTASKGTLNNAFGYGETESVGQSSWLPLSLALSFGLRL